MGRIGTDRIPKNRHFCKKVKLKYEAYYKIVYDEMSPRNYGSWIKEQGCFLEKLLIKT